MANAILFKRTKDTPLSGSTWNTVAKLVAEEPTQALEFNTSTAIIENNVMLYANRIVAKPSPTNDGTRLIKIQDNGAERIGFDVSGYLKVSNDAGIKKLINFAKEVQVETTATPHANDHKYGKFGLYYPNSTRLGFDPTPSAGLSISTLELTHQPMGKIVAFKMRLEFGGTYIALT